MSKRANGEGSVRQRPNGRWEGRLSYLDPVTEERKSVSVYGSTDAECRKKLREVSKRVERGQPAKDSTMPVGLWVKEWRESSLLASNRRPTTKALYAGLARKHLENGAISRHPLDKLKPSHVERLIVELRGKGLSESTVRQVYTVLRAALDIAQRDHGLADNPAAKVARPKVEKNEARFLEAADVRSLLEHSRGSRYYAAVLLMATTGMRRGEVVGLSWQDVKLDKAKAKVRHTVTRVDGSLTLSEPKTNRSRRELDLAPVMVAELKALRTRQKVERLKAGDQWSDTGMVFTTEFGTMVDPRNLLRVVQVAAKAAGLEGVRAHTLRHSAAMQMLEAGTHIKAVSDILGHSSISVTGDIYGHTSDDTAKAAISGLGEAFG